MPLKRSYPVEIVRRFAAGSLQPPSETELDRGEEDGLAGNQDYQDLRGLSWDQTIEALEEEALLFARFDAAADLDAEAESFEEERAAGEDPLLGLDVGVAGAVFALSALGAVPVGSCNAGGFGGRHSARFPYVVFYLDAALADTVLAIADQVDVGLDIIDGGLARLYGRSDIDLHRFAEAAARFARRGND